MPVKLFRDRRFMGSYYSRLPYVSFSCLPGWGEQHEWTGP